MKVYFVGVVVPPERLLVSEANLDEFGFFQRTPYVSRESPRRRRRGGAGGEEEEKRRREGLTQGRRHRGGRGVHRAHEFMIFFAKTIAKRTDVGMRQSVTEKRTHTRLQSHNAHTRDSFRRPTSRVPRHLTCPSCPSRPAPARAPASPPVARFRAPLPHPRPRALLIIRIVLAWPLPQSMSARSTTGRTGSLAWPSSTPTTRSALRRR